MAVRNIVKEGDEVLTKKCRPVERFDEKLAELAEDMKQTLAVADGLGLAGPQVGVLRRIAIVIDDDKTPIVLVNPVITNASGHQEGREGCLSVPGVFGLTDRPAKVTVKAQDVTGKEFTLTRKGITAVCICHEVDHLDGILFRSRVKEYLDD